MILLATAIAKLISSFGSAPLLNKPDPLLALAYRYVFWIAGVLELTVSLICILDKDVILRLWLVGWLSTLFVLYRISMPLVGYEKPCPCLGSLTGAIHVSPRAADIGLKIVLAYLVIGSYGMLYWFWRHRSQSRVVR